MSGTGVNGGADDEDGAGAGEDPRIAAVRSEIAALIERIDEVALELLREAVAAGERERPPGERRLVRVRNALLRAMGTLEG